MSRPTISISIDSTHLHSPSVHSNTTTTTTTTTTTSSSSSTAGPEARRPQLDPGDTGTAPLQHTHVRYPSASSSVASAPSSPQLVLGNSQKKNRSALRQFYGLTSAAQPAGEARDEASSAATGELESEREPEKPDVDPVAYVNGLCKTADLRTLLRMENELINEIRGLDGERKALVYDNYSKLISATDTIKKMRNSMEPLTPATSTLEPAISHIAQISTSLATTIQNIRPLPSPTDPAAAAAALHKKKIVKWALAAPERVQCLVKEGKTDEAQREWAAVTTLLEKWGDGVKGVSELREQGEKALSGL